MHKKFALALFLLLLATLSAPAQSLMPACGSSGDLLFQNFPPHFMENPPEDLPALFASYDRDYFSLLQERDDLIFSRESRRSWPDSRLLPAHFLRQTEFNLSNALARFYSTGTRPYDLQLSPLFILSPSNDPAAFATGRTVLLNEGLVAFFLAPQTFLDDLLSSHKSLSDEDRTRIRAAFSWHDDWSSLYFLLAHEAAHNLLKHPDQRILQTATSRMLDRYAQRARDQRHDLSFGKIGFGTKFARFFSESNPSFDSLLDDSSRQRDSEENADALALYLLADAGLDPDAARLALDRLALLLDDSVLKGGLLRRSACNERSALRDRSTRLASQLSCVHSSGRFCGSITAFSIPDTMQASRQRLADIETYRRTTQDIASRNPQDSSSDIIVRIEVKPKDAQLTIDGSPLHPGSFQLQEGPHTLEVSRDGYLTETRQIVAFPDIQLKLKIDLKKQK